MPTILSERESLLRVLFLWLASMPVLDEKDCHDTNHQSQEPNHYCIHKLAWPRGLFRCDGVAAHLEYAVFLLRCDAGLITLRARVK